VEDQGIVTTAPRVPISWGELFDKLTILEIKSERLTGEAALANVRIELKELIAIADPIAVRNERLAELRSELKRVNTALWEIEDEIRDCEARTDFGERFVTLARSVYVTNDERGRIKRAINTLLDSALFEEKQYTAY
jgi:hypothetical protein